MNNKLPTNRDPGTMLIRAALSFGILAIIDERRMQKDLDTIAYQHQHKKPAFPLSVCLKP